MTSLDTPRAKNLALALLAMTQLVIVIDASIVNVALPSIGSDLNFSQENLSWVINAYALTFGGFLLLGGRISDYFGRRRTFLGGMLLFTFASGLGGLAQSDEMLIGARALQGLGGAITSPAALAILTTTFAEGSERNKALGVWGAAGGAGGAIGVLLGGVLTEYIGWQAVLWVNVPVGLFIAWQTPRRLIESSIDDADRSFDVAGAVSITAGLSLLVFALVDAPNEGWGSGSTLGRIAGAAALIALFIVLELRTRKPLVPFSIFRLRTLRGANVIGLLIGMSLFSMFFLITLYLQQVLGMSAIETGLAYLPLSVFIIVSAGVASQLVTKIGFKPVLATGLAFVAAGLLWFTQIDTDGGWASDMLGPSLLAAIGLGFSFVTSTIAAMTGTSPGEAGLASGLINSSQQVGGALGLAILASIANSTTSDALKDGTQPLVALNEGFQDAFLVGTGFALAGVALALLLISTRDSRQHALAAKRGDAAAVVSA
ncbi:MAG TPA: MFS transporter [Solirubrobacteraceae bacterium]